MPRAKSPENTSDHPKPPSRRKARPKFEVEPEQVTTPAAGWVYREGDEPEVKPDEQPVVVVHEKTAAHEESTAHRKRASAADTATTIPMMAFGVAAVGIGTFVHVALFAVKTLNSPVRLASGILGRLRRP